MGVDLSGTYIKARDHKRIAVFQGNPRGTLSVINGADMMYEQAMPIRYAGKEFMVPNLAESFIDFILFTGLVDGTDITIMDPSDPSLPTRTLHVDARESNWFLMDTNEGPFYITSNHPILTSAFASMAAGICFSRSTTLSALNVVGLPLMMSVTVRPENIMLPFISLTPGMLVSAS